MSKGSAFKVLVVGFILFVVFKPEQSQKMYDELSAKLMPVQTSSVSDEDRLKAEVSKVQKVLSENEKELKDTPTPSPKVECKCGGTGEIVQGDGHKTPCPCPKPCECEKPKMGSMPPEEMEKFIETAVQKSFDKYVADYAKRQQEKAASQRGTTNRTSSMSVLDEFAAEVATEVKDDSQNFGSITITLMVVGIIINVIRLMMDCNLFGRSLEDRVKNPGPFDRILLKKAVRDGLTKDQRVLQGQIYEGIISKSKNLTSEQLSAMVEEVKK